MAIAPVLQWLTDPNRTYHHGKLLYEQYGKNIVAKTIINTGHQGSNFHFTYLENALREISDLTPAIVKADLPDLQSFTTKPKPGISDEEYAKLPADLRELRKDSKNHYNRAKYLYARIPLVDSKEQRLEMAIMLLNDFDENRRQMGHVQGFLDNGTYTKETVILKELKPVSDLTVRELIAESKNIPTYISKDRTRLEGVTDPNRISELNSRISARQERLEQINRRLNE